MAPTAARSQLDKDVLIALGLNTHLVKDFRPPECLRYKLSFKLLLVSISRPYGLPGALETFSSIFSCLINGSFSLLLVSSISRLALFWLYFILGDTRRRDISCTSRTTHTHTEVDRVCFVQTRLGSLADCLLAIPVLRSTTELFQVTRGPCKVMVQPEDFLPHLADSI